MPLQEILVAALAFAEVGLFAELATGASVVLADAAMVGGGDADRRRRWGWWASLPLCEYRGFEGLVSGLLHPAAQIVIQFCHLPDCLLQSLVLRHQLPILTGQLAPFQCFIAIFKLASKCIVMLSRNPLKLVFVFFNLAVRCQQLLLELFLICG